MILYIFVTIASYLCNVFHNSIFAKKAGSARSLFRQSMPAFVPLHTRPIEYNSQQRK